MTGWGQSSDVAASLDAGFDVHLVKPVSAEQVGALLRDFRRAHSAGQL